MSKTILSKTLPTLLNSAVSLFLICEKADITYFKKTLLTANCALTSELCVRLLYVAYRGNHVFNGNGFLVLKRVTLGDKTEFVYEKICI